MAARVTAASRSADNVVTITLRSDTQLIAAGSTPAPRLNVTATSGNFADVAGNTWDPSGSGDVVPGAPD